jgi:hypothetical protein
MTAPRRPRSPDGIRADPDTVRSYRMDQATYDAYRAKADEEDPPRTMSDVVRALLEAWYDDRLVITYLGDDVTQIDRRRAPAS